MASARMAVALGGLLLLAGAAWAYQNRRTSYMYEREMQNPAVDPADADLPGEWAFARLRYRSAGGWRRGSWGTDANKADRVFTQGVRRLTRVQARSVEEIIDVDTDDMFDWPWLYAVEVGRWSLTDAQAKKLRDYLDRGGFLMVDDFHGTAEWEQFTEGLRKIFPDRVIVDIPDGDPIFHVLYDLEKRFQIPGHQYAWTGRTYERSDGVEAHWRAILDDKGRVQVAICHNVDLGDAWEWADDPEYPEAFASLAYRIGINYIVYSMTH